MHFFVKKKWSISGSVFGLFQERCFVESCRFLRCVQCPKTLNLSYQNQHLEILYGQKGTRSRKKGQKKLLKKFNLGQKNGTRKWVVEVVLLGTLKCTLYTVHCTLYTVHCTCKPCIPGEADNPEMPRLEQQVKR